MTKQAVAEEKKIFGLMEVEIAVAVAICMLVSMLIPSYQVMTACITALLCTQSKAAFSWKAGLTRIIITAIGGVAGVLVVLLDNWVNNQWLLILWVMLGVILTMMGCKLAKVPEFSARIGGVTFILVVLTLTGTNRIMYAMWRLISTVGGVVIVTGVSAIFSRFFSHASEKPYTKVDSPLV